MPENYPDPWTDNSGKAGSGTVADAIGGGSSSHSSATVLRGKRGQFVSPDVEPAFDEDRDDTDDKPVIPGL